MAVARVAGAWVRRRRDLEVLAARIGWPQISPGLFAFGLLASVGIADGGLLPRTWRLAAFATFAVAAAALLAREQVRVRRLGWIALATLVALGLWIGLSATWSIQPTTSVFEAERASLYVAAVFAILVLVERCSLAHLIAGALAGITVASAYGLALYLFTSPPLDPFQGALLYQPIGYANALGIFDAIGVLLAIGLALASRNWAARGASLAPLGVLVPSLLLTSSRGAWVGFLAGLAALVLLRGELGRRGLVVVAVVAVLVAAAIVFVTEDARTFFTENRLRYWKLAWEVFLDHPLLGGGAGTFGDYWLEFRSAEAFSRTAHSLYMQALAELGLVGFALTVAAVSLPLAGLSRRDPLVATAAAGYIAFVCHAGLDWDWQVPAVTLAGLVCGTGLLVERRDRAPALTRSARLALALAALVLAAYALVRLETGGPGPFGHLAP